MQTNVRAASHVRGKAILYADRITDSMKVAIGETDRRRQIQIDYNLEHGIVPTTIQREVMDVMEGARGAPEPGKPRRGAKQVADEAAEYASLDPRQVTAKLKQLEAQMYQHARDLEFEKAAAVRDEIQKLREHGLANPL
jgi:excinuclease ABC subunit B